MTVKRQSSSARQENSRSGSYGLQRSQNRVEAVRGRQRPEQKPRRAAIPDGDGKPENSGYVARNCDPKETGEARSKARHWRQRPPGLDVSLRLRVNALPTKPLSRKRTSYAKRFMVLVGGVRMRLPRAGGLALLVAVTRHSTLAL
jgi:hypothetical protein